MWDDDETGRLLEVVKQWWKPLRNARNKRLIWAKIAEQVGPHLNADKVIDKWKMMKKKYRKMFPEPFPFSNVLRELLGDIDVNDFNSSDFLSVDGDSNNANAQEPDPNLMNALLEQPQTKKRRVNANAQRADSQNCGGDDADARYQLFYDMKHMLEERDEKMMKMFKEFQQDNARLLQQLIANMPKGP